MFIGLIGERRQLKPCEGNPRIAWRWPRLTIHGVVTADSDPRLLQHQRHSDGEDHRCSTDQHLGGRPGQTACAHLGDQQQVRHSSSFIQRNR